MNPRNIQKAKKKKLHFKNCYIQVLRYSQIIKNLTQRFQNLPRTKNISKNPLNR